MSVDSVGGLEAAVDTGVKSGYLKEGTAFDIQRAQVNNTLIARAQIPNSQTGLIDANQEAVKVYKESLSLIVSNGLGRAIDVLKLYSPDNQIEDDTVDLMHGELAKRVVAMEAGIRIKKIDREFIDAKNAYIDASSLGYIRNKLAHLVLGRNGNKNPGNLLATYYVWNGDAQYKSTPDQMHAAEAVRLFEEHDGTVDEALVTTVDTQIKEEFSVTYNAFRALHESRILGLDLEALGIHYE